MPTESTQSKETDHYLLELLKHTLYAQQVIGSRKKPHFLQKNQPYPRPRVVLTHATEEDRTTALRKRQPHDIRINRAEGTIPRYTVSWRSVEGYVATLPQPERFNLESFTPLPEEYIPAGTQVLVLENVEPLGYIERIADSPEMRNLAKLVTIQDLLTLIWNLPEDRCSWELCYGVTNQAMARFMCDHLGYYPCSQKNKSLIV